jgi:hypothetical protein
MKEKRALSYCFLHFLPSMMEVKASYVNSGNIHSSDDWYIFMKEKSFELGIVIPHK